MKTIVSILTLLTFLGCIAFSPARAGMTRSSELARQVFAHLYRNLSAPEIEDFSASFFVRVSQNAEFIATTSEEDLTPLSKGRLFFKKPHLLRVESTLLYPAGLQGSDFVEIRNGRFIYAYKNGVDLPIGQAIDDPSRPSNYIPFGFQLPILPRDLVITLLGRENSLGVKTYVLGLMDRTDPYHDVLKVWVDADHYFVRKTEWYDLRTQPSTMEIVSSSGPISIYKNTPVKITTLYEDPLRLPNGYWIPMRMERFENWTKDGKGPGNLAQVVVYSRVSVNSNLSDTLFQAPRPRIPMPFSTFMGQNQ